MDPPADAAGSSSAGPGGDHSPASLGPEGQDWTEYEASLATLHDQRDQLRDQNVVPLVSYPASSSDDSDGSPPLARRVAAPGDLPATDAGRAQDIPDGEPVAPAQDQEADARLQRGAAEAGPSHHDPAADSSDTDCSPIPCGQREQRRGDDPADPAATASAIIETVIDEEANSAYATYILPGDYRNKLQGACWNGLIAFHPPATATTGPAPDVTRTARAESSGGPSTASDTGPANLVPLQAAEGHTHFTFPNPGPNRRRALTHLIKLLGVDESFLHKCLAITFLVTSYNSCWFP